MKFPLFLLALWTSTVSSQLCRPEEFKCASGPCIDGSWACDFILDCPDGSDEYPLNPACPCPYDCHDGTCIPEEYVCDWYTDCADGSDEENCPCEFICPDGICIPKDWICDGYNDCGDNSDEINCPCPDDYPLKCPNTEECIKEDYWCDEDGVWDCSDGADQANCTKSLKSQRRSLEKNIKLTQRSGLVGENKLSRHRKVNADNRKLSKNQRSQRPPPHH